MARAIEAGVVVVTRRAADRLRAGHGWVYRTDIEDAGAVEPGGLVTVVDSRLIPLGSGTYSAASMIAVRLWTREPGLSRDRFLELLRERMAASIGRREELESCRLVFSEADELPGIVVDKYGDLIVFQLLTQGTAQDDVRRLVVEVLRETTAARAIVERPDARVRELEELAMVSSEPLYLADGAGLAAVFELNGLKFNFDANAGQKTGAFLDQRLNYAAAASYGFGEALDICTYQGGFALHLARVCTAVTAVDQSRVALEVAEKNELLNREQMKSEVEWIEADAFELLRAYESENRQFDTIVLDPPAFAKTKRAAAGAMRGYKELNLRALKMLRPGGILATCSCSHHVGLEEFTGVVASAASDAGRRVRLLETRGAAPDHPEVLTLPETRYLKCLIARVD